jgi:hypothetical protein
MSVPKDLTDRVNFHEVTGAAFIGMKCQSKHTALTLFLKNKESLLE